MSSTQVAELAKLLENIFRTVNIALVNELKMLCDRMGIDVWEVIDAASTKPFGFMPFYPGPGLGGHCIPIDPFYLTWKARQFEFPTKFIELAGEVNTQMPTYVVQRTMDALNDRQKSLKGSKLLILGAAYKKHVDDVREIPVPPGDFAPAREGRRDRVPRSLRASDRSSARIQVGDEIRSGRDGQTLRLRRRGHPHGSLRHRLPGGDEVGVAGGRHAKCHADAVRADARTS